MVAFFSSPPQTAHRSTFLTGLAFITSTSSPVTKSLFPRPGVFPLAGIEPMDCDDMQAATSVIITQRDVKWSSGFHHSHHEALWERSGARTLLNDPTFFQNPEGL